MNTDTENELIVLARDRDMEAVEALWMQRIETDPPDLEELFQAARYLVSRNLQEQAGILLWSLVMSVAERGNMEAALPVAKRAACTAPTEKALREEILNLYRQTRAGALRLERILQDSNLLDTKDVEGALKYIDEFLRLQPGAYVVHRMSHSVGRVIGFEEDSYIIESDGSKFRHPPQQFFQWWSPLDADDFRAQLAFNGEKMRRLAEENPELLIRNLLASYRGSIDFKQLKVVLIPALVEQRNWSKWWTRAKTAVKQSPWINLSGGTQPTLTLRTAPAAYSETLLKHFNASANPFDKINVVLEYLSDLRAGGEHDAQLAIALGKRLIKQAETSDEPTALASLAAAAALRDAQTEAPDPSDQLADCLKRLPDPAGILAQLEKDDVARMVIERIRPVAPQQWPEIFAEAFPAASPRICDYIARELGNAGHEHLLLSAAETTAAMPDKYPLAYAWVWGRLISKGGPLADKISPVSATSILLHLMHRLARLPKHAKDRARSRRTLTRLRSIVGANSAKRLKELIAQTDSDQAARLHEAISDCDGLTGEMRHDLLGALRDAHPDTFAEKRNLWEDGNIYLSPEGYAKLHAALDKILNQDMRRNAKAIGVAAAKGDLRENWEYKAALEERDRLVERATRMREELDRAHVLSPSDVTADHATVGTSLRLLDTQTGAERGVTFLGPWDADIDRSVYSYLAPLSRNFMGKTIGDRVTVDLGDGATEYQIVTIEKTL